MSNQPNLIRYFFVGVSTYTIYMGLTFALVEWAGFPITLSSFISCSTAVLFNYVMHYHWTFSTDSPHGQVLARYALMVVGGIVLNTLVMYVGVQFSSLHYMLLQVIAGGMVIIWNFVLSATWVYR